MNIVLVEPEIHWNTGNIGRSCVATGAELHLVGNLGFRLDAKEIRRAGLDYWPRLRLSRHPSLETFLDSLPAHAPLFFFSTKGRQVFWDAPYRPGSYLVFGKETGGLPAWVHERHSERVYRIPMLPGERSLNLSTAAGVVLFEALRQTRCNLERSAAAA